MGGLRDNLRIEVQANHPWSLVENFELARIAEKKATQLDSNRKESRVLLQLAACSSDILDLMKVNALSLRSSA